MVRLVRINCGSGDSGALELFTVTRVGVHRLIGLREVHDRPD